MLIGVPREIKTREYRVGMVPANVRELVARGHKVIVGRDPGAGIGVTNEHYRNAGSAAVNDADGFWGDAEIVVMVNMPRRHLFRSQGA